MNTLLIVALLGCGRETENADVRLVGVGSDPEEIGPPPTPYGGLVGYDNVELAGGGLALAHVGFGSFEEIGPSFANASAAPPYRMTVGQSYLFDTKLTAADTMTFSAPVPPENIGTCYTTYSPEGPIGSFSTVDVGDYMEFAAPDGSTFRMNRYPTDVPPDARDMFVYYSKIQPWAPSALTHRVPDPADPTNPNAMIEEAYITPNFPFGEQMTWQFPGGVTRFDQPVSSIPRPSSSVAPNAITLPVDMKGVQITWNGARFDADGNPIAEVGEQSQCLEFYGEGREVAPDSPEACDEPPTYPTDKANWDSFPGQIYTGPWDAEDGRVTLRWTPSPDETPVSFAVRFMAPVDETDPNYQYAEVDGRPATACEQTSSTPFVFDDSIAESPAMAGDPFSKMVEVSCLFEDTGEAVITVEQLADALEYLGGREAGGAIFFFGRQSEVEAYVPPVKDQYDEKHDVNPVLVSSKIVRVGRFHWDGSAGGGVE